MKSRTVTATEFKAKCLALLDDIGQNGGTITVTKRGRPLAVVGPVHRQRWPSSQGIWKGKVHIPDGDLMADRSGTWDIVRGRS